MKTFYLFVLSVAMIFISCRKKGDASGKVVNILNGKPIEGLIVHLDEYKLRLITDKTIKKHLETTTTNAEGEYAMKYGAKLETRYKNRLVYIDDDYYAEMDTSALLDVKYDNGNYPGCEKVRWDYDGNSRKNLDFYLAPLSRIKIIPHNVTHIYDGLDIDVYLFDSNYSKRAAYYHGGNTANSGYYVQFPSNGRISIVWSIAASGTQNFYDTIHVEPFAKTIFHFNY